MPTGEGKLGWIDVRDIAEVNATILQNPQNYVNREFTITGPENLSFQDTTAILSEVLNKQIAFTDVLGEAAITEMRNSGIPEIYN